jgi:hypothetical protein
MDKYHRRNYSKSRAPSEALRHIAEAKTLSLELGGTDQDVKKWFFNLAEKDLLPILDTYQNEYGHQARDYAFNAIPKWRSGKTKMSGMVAARLFKLLPNYMSLGDKYKLVDSLWKHVGPTKKRLIEVGSEANVDEVINVFKDEVMALATKWDLPGSLHKRFSWLGQDDASVYKQLLGHIQENERLLAVSILEQQVPVIQQNFKANWQEVSSHINYTIDIGKQSVELRILANKQSIEVKDWKPFNNSVNRSESGFEVPWGFLIFIIILFIFFNL